VQSLNDFSIQIKQTLMKIFFTYFIIVALTASCTSINDSTNSAPTENELTKDERMGWWRQSKFGLFIHWGVYAVPAGVHDGKETLKIGEWIMNHLEIPIAEYEKYAQQFNPVEFDADQWVRLAKSAGMKYIVITSKHHDGFGLWDSKVSNYDVIDASRYKKDILKQLSDACKAHGIKFGLYYSIMDWHHPQAQSINEPKYFHRGAGYKINPEFSQYLENYMKPQLKELIENYDPAILWFDGEWMDDYTHEQGVDIYEYIMKLKPDLIVNNRVDKGRNGMQGMNTGEEFVGDFGTPEQEILATASDLDWESCMTMNDTWGFKKNDQNWKSTEQLIFNLVDVVAKGGNYLLNIGPTAQGIIPSASVERLAQIGEWMSVNGEAIYGTMKLDNGFGEGDEIRYTRNPDSGSIYGVKFKSLGDQLVLKNIKPTDTTEIKLLGYNEKIKFSYDENIGITIEIPKSLDQSNWETSKAWVFKIEHAEDYLAR